MTEHAAGQGFRRAWELAIAAFVVAAATGVALRLWLSGGVVVGPPEYVRHAHSHLMYMGWATPALMAIMAARLPDVGGAPAGRLLRGAVTAAFVFAAVAWACFLRWGYSTVAFGPVEMPPAAAVSGLAMLAWYVFAGGFVARLRNFGTPAAFLWTAALVALLVSSGGAWGEAAVLASGSGSEFWAIAFVRLFVDVFGEGWLVLATLGLLADAHGVRRPRVIAGAAATVVVAAPFTFALTMPASITPDAYFELGRVAAVVTGVAVLVAMQAITGPAGLRGAWRVVWFALAAKALFLAMAGVGELGRWGLVRGLQIPYLHLLFLTGVSTALFARARSVFGPRSAPDAWIFAIASVVVLASLIPMTGVWPRAWVGSWIRAVAIVAATAPLGVVLVHLVRHTSGAPRAPGN